MNNLIKHALEKVRELKDGKRSLDKFLMVKIIDALEYALLLEKEREQNGTDKSSGLRS